MTNIRWALHTVQHCINVIHERDEDSDDSLDNSKHSDEIPRQMMLADLTPFVGLITDIVSDLSVSKHKKNYEHYDRTIRRLIEGMIDDEPEENDDIQNREVKLHQKNNRLTINEIKKALLKQGKYHEFDFKCHSFKSFIHLIRINQLFRELKNEPKNIEDQPQTKELLAAGVDDIANDFINQLNGEDVVKRPSLPIHRLSQSRPRGRSTVTKLEKIEEAKETPVSNGAELDGFRAISPGQI